MCKSLTKKNALHLFHVKGVCSSCDALFSATRPSFTGSVALRPRVTTGLLLAERYVCVNKMPPLKNLSNKKSKLSVSQIFS